jgi:hypothetical protein
VSLVLAGQGKIEETDYFNISNVEQGICSAVISLKSSKGIIEGILKEMIDIKL